MTQPALGQSLPERHRHRVWPWALALTGALVAITWLATTLNPPRDLDTGWDKSNHLLAFAVLALLADRMVIAWRRGTAARLAASGLVLAYGGLKQSDVKIVEFSSYGAMWKGLVNNEADAAFASTMAASAVA